MLKFIILVFSLFVSVNSTIAVDATSNPNCQNEMISSKKKMEQKNNQEIKTQKFASIFDNIIYPDDIENYDYFELLEEESTPFMNWLATIFDFSNSSDIEFIDENFNKLMLKAINENIIGDVFNRPATKFGGNTHKQLTTDALSLLLKDNKNSAYNFYSNFINILRDASKQPDVDEKHSGTHYYVYGTTLSDGYYKNADGPYSISARTRFEEHYYTAINAYKNGKTTIAMDELGRALHYLQDTAATPHSANLRATFSWYPHVLYETWVNLAYPGSSIYVASSANEFYTTVLNLDNPGSILNQIAKFSYQYKDIVKDYSKDTTDLNYSYYVTVASACLPYSQKMTAAVLNRFYEDVTNASRKTSYIKDGSIYYIKNVGTGKYIDVKSWSTENDAITHPYTFHGDTNQQFRAEIQNDGSFKFIPMNAPDKKLHISRIIGSSWEKLNITGVGHKFRPVYYKNGNYRIIPEYDTVGNTPTERYYKYPIAQDDDFIGVRSSDIWTPSNSNYYWQFQEALSISTGESETFLGKNETKKVLINVANTGYYNIETLGLVDTYFENLVYRVGRGNTSLTTVISQYSDDEGDGLNAKYSNVYLEIGKIYILTLRGRFASTAGQTTIKVSGLTPDAITKNQIIRTGTYTITDDGRFTNPYDEINLEKVFGQNVATLKQLGYTKVSITLEFYAYEINDGYQYFWIYDGTSSSSTSLYGREFEHTPGSQNGNSIKYIFNDIEFDLDDVLNNSVYVRYGASGSGNDTWCNYNLSTQIRIS